MLDNLPHRDLICGFLSGKNEILNWEPSDLFQFCNDTTPIKGSLDEVMAVIDESAVSRAIKIGACNIYHGCVHNMLHEKSEDILRGLYKSASFVVQAILIWILIIPLAILNGGLRENVLNKLGDIALTLSGIILSICIFVVAFVLIPKIKHCNKGDYLIFGLLWFILTNIFDLSMYLSEGGGFFDLLNSYNFLSGNLWILVVFTTFVAPILVAKIKKII
jgi:hypothetical protein